MSALVACPFCRELFDSSEADECPHCEIALVPFERLPPSYETIEREAADWERDGDEDLRRSLWYVGAGRGALALIAVAGLLTFALAPWVEITTPHALSRTGYSLARGPLAWLWGGAVAWLTCLALVLTRRTLNQMRGVRAIVALMSSMTLVEGIMLLAGEPEPTRLVPLRYEWTWGLYASLALSVLGVALSLRFGGSPEARSEPRPTGAGRADPGTGTTHTVH